MVYVRIPGSGEERPAHTATKPIALYHPHTLSSGLGSTLAFIAVGRAAGLGAWPTAYDAGFEHQRSGWRRGSG